MEVDFKANDCFNHFGLGLPHDTKTVERVLAKLNYFLLSIPLCDHRHFSNLFGYLNYVTGRRDVAMHYFQLGIRQGNKISKNNLEAAIGRMMSHEEPLTSKRKEHPSRTVTWATKEKVYHRKVSLVDNTTPIPKLSKAASDGVTIRPRPLSKACYKTRSSISRSGSLGNAIMGYKKPDNHITAKLPVGSIPRETQTAERAYNTFSKKTRNEYFEMAIAYMAFKMNVAAMEAIQKYDVQSNLSLLIYGMVKYKMGKGTNRPSKAVSCLREAITTLNTIRSYTPAEVILCRARNRLFALTHALGRAPPKRHSIIAMMPETECRFMNVVVNAVTKETECRQKYDLKLSNFPLTLPSDKVAKGELWSCLKVAGDLIRYQRYRAAYALLKPRLSECNYYKVYHKLALCLTELSSSGNCTAVGLTSENALERITEFWRSAIGLNQYRDLKVVLCFGKYLRFRGQFKESEELLRLCLASPSPVLRKSAYLELLQVLLQSNLEEAARILLRFGRNERPPREVIVSNLRRLTEKFLVRGQRSDIIHWNNVLLSSGLINPEDIRKMPHSFDIFHKLRKGSLDGACNKNVGSPLLKALTLNYSPSRKGMLRTDSKDSKRAIFSNDC